MSLLPGLFAKLLREAAIIYFHLKVDVLCCYQLNDNVFVI